MVDDAQSERRGARKSVGRGGNRLLMDNGLAQFDLMVGLKMTEFVRSRLLPNIKFLIDGWHIYSDTPGTLSWMCLNCLKDVTVTGEKKFQYWNNELISILNYKFITTKSESRQGFKKVFLGEDIFGSSSILLQEFFTNINRNAESKTISNILICVLQLCDFMKSK